MVSLVSGHLAEARVCIVPAKSGVSGNIAPERGTRGDGSLISVKLCTYNNVTMRTVLLLLLCTSVIQNRRRHRPRRRHSVLELDFKTPKLGFLPFSEDNRVIWSVYHLYIFYKRLTHLSIHRRWGMREAFKTFTLSCLLFRDLDAVYKYSNYYYRNLCLDGCPIDTVCRWGVCVCTNGDTNIASWSASHYRMMSQCLDLLLYKGHCETRAHVYHQSRGRVSSADQSPRGHVSSCDQSQSCQAGDINMLCVGTSETTSGSCSCRDDMRPNPWWARSGANLYFVRKLWMVVVAGKYWSLSIWASLGANFLVNINISW